MLDRMVLGAPAHQQNQLMAGGLAGTTGRPPYCFGNPNLNAETKNAMQFTHLEIT